MFRAEDEGEADLYHESRSEAGTSCVTATHVARNSAIWSGVSLVGAQDQTKAVFTSGEHPCERRSSRPISRQARYDRPGPTRVVEAMRGWSWSGPVLRRILAVQSG